MKQEIEIATKRTIQICDYCGFDESKGGAFVGTCELCKCDVCSTCGHVKNGVDDVIRIYCPDCEKLYQTDAIITRQLVYELEGRKKYLLRQSKEYRKIREAKP